MATPSKRTTMPSYAFSLVLSGAEVTDDDCGRLFEAGCDDGTVVTRDGVTHIAFDRQAESLEAAIGSAIGEVMNAGFTVNRVQVDNPAIAEATPLVVWELDDLVQDELREYFCHFVPLSGCYHTVDSYGEPTGHAGAFHYSGFILEVEGQWYWVTAGHVFDDEDKGIETLRRRGKIVIDECVLNDSFALPRTDFEPIPFKYQDYELIKCYNPELGLDYCAIRLRSHYIELLSKNRVVPLREANWKHPHLSQLDHFLVVGLPEELEHTQITSEPDGYRVRTRPQPAAVYISRVRQLPRESVRPVTRFAGRVGKPAGNMAGMSGGPIFGVRVGGENHYLVALQSSWLESKRLVFGCPISELISRLATEQQR